MNWCCIRDKLSSSFSTLMKRKRSHNCIVSLKKKPLLCFDIWNLVLPFIAVGSYEFGQLLRVCKALCNLMQEFKQYKGIRITKHTHKEWCSLSYEHIELYCTMAFDQLQTDRLQEVFFYYNVLQLSNISTWMETCKCLKLIVLRYDYMAFANLKHEQEIREWIEKCTSMQKDVIVLSYKMLSPYRSARNRKVFQPKSFVHKTSVAFAKNLQWK